MKRLGCSEREIVADYMVSKENLMAMLIAYAKEHVEVDLDIIVPREDNIQRVLK